MFQGAPASLGVTDRTIAMEGRDENYMEKRARREDNHGQPGPVAGHMVLDLNLAPGDIRTCHVVPRRLFVRNIPCRRSWDSLSTRDKLFAHHFAKASWAGSRICARQLSPESPDILRIILLMFYGASPIAKRQDFLDHGISREAWDFCISYCACFLANLGNYLAFGDVKMIPGIPVEEFERIVMRASYVLDDDRQGRLVKLWSTTKSKIYSLEQDETRLALYPKGVCMYYTGNITEEEVYLVQQWMATHSMESWNTRIHKRKPGGQEGLPEYEIHIASSIDYPAQTHTYEGKCIIYVMFGDHKDDLEEVVLHLRHALKFAPNETQRAAVVSFIQHFETGSIDKHKDSQRHWLSDVGGIDANIGFMETYRDPLGYRAEFEGYVAIPDKEQTAKFAALAEASRDLLPHLPWPKDFERDFEHPIGFTSLAILMFANGNIPAGINLPNYEDIRQSYGCRNIAFGNVLHSESPEEEITFLKDSDRALLFLRKSAAMEIQLGCHELLGHGSGKLFVKNVDGTYNYEHGKVLHPFTESADVSCYKAGDRFDTVFGEISSAYEECRAECVGVFFSTKEEVLQLFGHSGREAEDVRYAIWLLMIRAGLLSLEYFSPETGLWRQPHMQARFAILRILLAASGEAMLKQEREGGAHGPPFLQIQRVGEDGALIMLEKDQIQTVGLPAISALMTRLQVYKSTADINNGRRLYEQITGVPDYLLAFRGVVLAQKRPRPFLLQANTFETHAGVELKGYEATAEGFVQSFIDRFRSWITVC